MTVAEKNGVLGFEILLGSLEKVCCFEEGLILMVLNDSSLDSG